MLLLDLLATKLNRWPTGATYISQGSETGALYDHDGNMIKPKTTFPKAENASSKTIVYRGEWLARRRELAAETEQASPAPELSTAQRLKKARAEEAEPVQVAAFNPHHHTLTISGRGHSMSAPAKTFEPLDFSGPVRDYSLKTPSPMPEPMTPIQWLSMDGEWKDGVYVGTVYGRIAVGCDLTHVVGWVTSGEIRIKPSKPLLELLAQQWESWPQEFGQEVCQASDGRIYPVGAHSGIALLHVPLATDQEEATVTHGQWSWHRSNHTILRTTKGLRGWDDRGYPLKGTTCEYNVSRAGETPAYITVHVVYASPSIVAFDCTYVPEGVTNAVVGQEYHALPTGFGNPFRAIRSPSQIKEDEQAVFVDAMLALDSSGGMLSRRDFCKELLKAGYAPAIESDLSRTATLAKLGEAYLQGASDHRGGLEAIYDHGFRLLAQNS